jgi:hypothetical protein
MRLRAIRPGDVVLIDKRGRRFEATVREVVAGELAIVPLDRRVTYYTARAREVRARRPALAGGEAPRA